MTKRLETRDATLATRNATVRLERKAVSDKGTFEGYGSVFGVVDSYREITAAGAFTKSLETHREAGTLPALLWQHRADKPIGHYTAMREDDTGLWVEGQLAMETQLGREAHALLKSGALNGLSIGFMPVKTEEDRETGIDTLTEIDLWEVSLVTFPANTAARVEGTKSLDAISGLASWKSFEGHLREAGYSNDAATAMVAAAKRIHDDEREARAEKADAHAALKALRQTFNT